MSDPIVLDTVGAVFDELPGGRAVLSASSTIELGWLPAAYVRDLVVRHVPPDSLVVELAVLMGASGAHLAHAGPVALRLAESPGGLSSLLLRATLGPSPAVSVHDLRLALDLQQPWLRRVDVDTGALVDEPFRLVADAAIRVASDGSSDIELFALSVPPFEIGTTGLILDLDDCQICLDGAPAPVSLRGLLGSNASMTGLHARRAILRWLPPFRSPLGGGLTLNYNDVAVEGTGVSFELDQSWNVDRARGHISAGSDLFGTLFDGRLRVAFERATGRVVHNRPDALALSGWLEVPSINALLRVRFQLELDRDNEASTELTLTQEEGVPISIDLGAGSMTVGDLVLYGALGNSAFSVAGAGSITVVLPGWSIGPTSAEFELASSPDGEDVGAVLNDLDLGPLGRVRTARLRLATVRHDAGETELDTFALEAQLEWRHIRSRLGLTSVPPELPQPAEDAVLIASVTWAAGGGLTLRFEAAAGDATSIFSFLPAPFRPEVRSVAFGFEARYAEAGSFFGATEGDPITGTAYARVVLRPKLGTSLAGLAELRVGDANGFVGARMYAELDTGGTTSLRLELDELVRLDLSVPGLTDGPLLTAELVHADLVLAAGRDTTTAHITLVGRIAVQPSTLAVANTLLAPLSAVLDPLVAGQLTGTFTADLHLQDDRAEAAFTATLDEAGIEYDLGDLVGQIASGRVTPGTRGSDGIDADMAVRLSLEALIVRIGSLADATQSPVSVELGLLGAIGAAEMHVFARISSEEFLIGVSSGDIPLRLAPFPLRAADLEDLRGGGGDWSDARFLAELQAWKDTANGLASKTDRDSQAERAALVARHQLAGFIRDRWRELGSDDTRRTYQDGVVGLLGLIETGSALTHVESDVRLVIGPAQLRVTFADPRRLAVEGGARLTGFAPNDPLYALDGTTLRLGLSADQVYFELEGTGTAVPLPEFGDYRDGSISLSQLTIGYGYTRNSLAVSFAGELIWPDGFTEDAETSAQIGFGLKLPQYNRGAFRLDLIPVPGPIPLVPMLEFAVDLRTPGAPALINTQVVRPAWDGLQLNVPGLVRADLKAVALSPVLGVLPVHNVRYDGDIDLGNDQFGLTLIVDELVVMLGLGTPPSPMPVPFLIDPAAPYFDHVSLNIRFAGFGVNVNVERPLPLPNPLLIFDVMGLIADPLRPLDPDSTLARLMRVMVSDAYISIPTWAQPLIPGGAGLARHELNLEVNLGTVIGSVQWLARVLLQTIRVAEQALKDGRAAIETIVEAPPRLDVDGLLALLPSEMRSFEAGLSIAGFHASATVILTRSLRLDHPALDGFDGSDRRAVPPLDPDVAAVVIVADVDLAGIANYRFLGRLTEDGSIVLLSQLDLRPLTLSIAGVRIALPLELDARLLLRGRITLTHRSAEVVATGRGNWDIVPGVLRVVAGIQAPVQAHLDSRGQFRILGDAAVELFGSTGIRIEGQLDASNAHLAVEGTLRFALGATQSQPNLELVATGGCQIGPGPRWAFAGDGRLRLFDLNILDVAVRLTDREITASLAVSRRRWRIGELTFDTFISADLDARFTLPESQPPRARLHGQGRLEMLGAALDGTIDIHCDTLSASLRAEGSLSWQGHSWLSGAIAVSSSGSVAISGRASVVLDLTPQQLPAGIKVASLFLRADIDGHFAFGGRGALADMAVNIDWSVGVRLPGAPAGQLFVLAMQKVHVKSGSALDYELLNVQGLSFVPLNDVMIPVPVISSSGTTEVYRVKFNIPVMDQVRFMATEDIIEFVEDNFGDDLIGGKRRLFSIPKNLSVEIEERSLGELAASFNFRVNLQWRKGELGFVISRQTQSQFYPFRDMV